MHTIVFITLWIKLSPCFLFILKWPWADITVKDRVPTLLLTKKSRTFPGLFQDFPGPSKHFSRTFSEPANVYKYKDKQQLVTIIQSVIHCGQFSMNRNMKVNCSRCIYLHMALYNYTWQWLKQFRSFSVLAACCPLSSSWLRTVSSSLFFFGCTAHGVWFIVINVSLCCFSALSAKSSASFVNEWMSVSTATFLFSNWLLHPREPFVCDLMPLSPFSFSHLQCKWRLVYLWRAAEQEISSFLLDTSTFNIQNTTPSELTESHTIRRAVIQSFQVCSQLQLANW